MKRADLFERKDGVLILSSTNGRCLVTPDYSIHKAIKRYHDYCGQYAGRLRDKKNICNWLPELQYFIFQKLIIPQTFYSEFLEGISETGVKFRYTNNVRVRDVFEASKNFPANFFVVLFRTLFIKLELFVCFLHNLFVFKEADILFFDYSVNDYRSKKALAGLPSEQKVARTFPSSFAFKCKNFFRKDCFFPHRLPS